MKKCQLTLFIAFAVRVSSEVIRAATWRPVRHHLADSIDTTWTSTGINTLVVDTGLAQGTVWVNGALWSAWLAKISGQTGTHGLAARTLAALRVGTTRARLTRWLGWFNHWCRQKENSLKSLEGGNNYAAAIKQQTDFSMYVCMCMYAWWNG